MHLSREASNQFRRAVFALWQLGDFSLRELMERAGVDLRRRHALWRELQFPEGRLESSEALRVVQTAVAMASARVPADEVWKCIVDPAAPPSHQVRELLVSEFVQPRRPAIRRLLNTLADYDQVDDKICFSVVPLLSALTEPVVLGVYRRATSMFGSRGTRAQSVLMNYFRSRAERRQQLAHRGGRTHLLFVSNLIHFRDGTGPFAHIRLMDRQEGHENYVSDVIDVHHEQVGVVNDLDGSVPDYLLRYFRARDGVFVTGTRFLMKVTPHSLHHSVVAATSPEAKAVISFERSKLLELKAWVRHGCSRDEMKQVLNRYAPVAS